MSASQKPEPGTSLATRPLKDPQLQARVEENKARNQLIAAIRGTQWGRDTTPEMARAVAQYCRENNLDPVRHVEILGGRIYLTAELYDEKGAHLLRSGEIHPLEPDYINADVRLDELAKEGDAWAVAENTRRKHERIRYNVPEKALAAVVQKFVLRSGASVVGVNWCGGVRGNNQYGKPLDPIGEADPTKTAQTRARRRAWKQIADILPGYAEIIRPLEGTARIASEMLPVAVVEHGQVNAQRPDLRLSATSDGAYGITSSEPEPVAQSNADTEDDLLAQDREILRAESEG